MAIQGRRFAIGLRHSLAIMHHIAVGRSVAVLQRMDGSLRRFVEFDSAYMGLVLFPCRRLALSPIDLESFKLRCKRLVTGISE